MAFSSAVTDIQQMNIIQHPYWGKIFPFQDDYAYISFKYKHLQLHFYHFYIASIHFNQIIIQEFSYYYYKFLYANV